jgi:hypothetical protein
VVTSRSTLTSRYANSKPHHIGSCTSSIGGTSNGNADIRTLKRRSIVDAITCHPTGKALPTESLDDNEFVLGEYL